MKKLMRLWRALCWQPVERDLPGASRSRFSGPWRRLNKWKLWRRLCGTGVEH